MTKPAPLRRAICKHSKPMLPCPKITTVSAIRSCAVSTAATLSLNDCRHAASLSEIRSSTFTRAISGSEAISEKQPGKSNPMTGPLRQRSLRSERQSGHSPQGSLARAATRSPGRNRLAPSVSRTRAQNSCPKSWTGASVSSRRLMRSKASVGIPCASCASVTLGCTQRGSTNT